MIQDFLTLPRKGALLWLVMPVLLAGCDPVAIDGPDAAPEPGVIEVTRNGPAGAPADSCWGKTFSPAVVQTVSKQEQIEPAKVNPDGTIGAPPKYRTTQTQKIVSPRIENWFETPCAEVLSAEFNATLQRALLARGLYSGPINGEMDARTRAAVQALQRIDGPDSGVLSLETARRLGLIAVQRSPSE